MSGDPILLEVARIVKPHGLRGQVVVELFTNRLERVAPGAVLQGPHGPMAVVAASTLPQGAGRIRCLVNFDGIGSRDQAEGLRDAILRAEPLEVPDALWVHDLIGTEVFGAGGEALGVVESVEANPASDLLVLADGGLIPLRFVTAREPGRLTVDVPPGLLDL